MSKPTLSKPISKTSLLARKPTPSVGTGTALAAAPIVGSFSPASGAPGTLVIILGQNFVNVQAVLFNGLAAQFVVFSSTEIEAIVPQSATTGPIAVRTAAGTGRSAASFLVTGVTTAPPPVYGGNGPVQGPPGTLVTIVGQNFVNVLHVRFNGVDAHFTVPDSSHIQATVPLTATTGPITIITATGSCHSNVPFTVTTSTAPPPVYGGNGPVQGPPGTLVTIVGQNFVNVLHVRFNGVDAHFTVPDSSHIQATVPQGATTGPITIITATGSCQSNVPFTVTGVTTALPPVFGGFGPIAGGPGTLVTITGQNFVNVQSVQFNGVNAQFTVPDMSHIQTIVPDGATTGPITITTASGSCQSNVPFQVPDATQPPRIATLSPVSGPPGTNVKIGGFNFINVQSVMFGTVNAQFTVPNEFEIDATVPDGGTGPITVTTPAGSANIPFTVT